VVQQTVVGSPTQLRCAVGGERYDRCNSGCVDWKLYRHDAKSALRLVTASERDSLWGTMVRLVTFTGLPSMRSCDARIANEPKLGRRVEYACYRLARVSGFEVDTDMRG